MAPTYASIMKAAQKKADSVMKEAEKEAKKLTAT